MHTATLFYTVLGFTLAAARIADNQQRTALEKTIQAGRSSKIPRSIQGVQSCQEVHANLDAEDKTLRITTCYLNTTEAQPHTDSSAKIDAAPQAIQGPICANEGQRPQPIDSTTLCEYIPGAYSLPPAYSYQSCSCETWSLGTALFAFCNCDPCNSVNDQFMLGRCEDILDDCILHDWARGYISGTNPSRFWTLWGMGGQLGASPVYTSCN